MPEMWGFRAQGRLHPDDLQLIARVVREAIRKELVSFMAQIDDLLNNLNAITADVANEISAHAEEVANLQSKIAALQDQVNNSQPVDLTAALQLTTDLRSKLEATANTAGQASDAAQSAVDASSQPASDQPTTDQPVSDQPVGGDAAAAQPAPDGTSGS